MEYGDAGEVAARLATGGQQAVGMANHHNPIAVIIPCHRVIGSNGSLTGHGAAWIATLLLDLENRSR